MEYGTEFVITVDLDEKFDKTLVRFLKNGTPISEPAAGHKSDHFTVPGDTTIVLDGNISINTYEVKWYSEGTLLFTEERQHGYNTAYPGTSNPTKESTASHTYTFSRWVLKGTQQAIPLIITEDSSSRRSSSRTTGHTTSRCPRGSPTRSLPRKAPASIWCTDMTSRSCSPLCTR